MPTIVKVLLGVAALFVLLAAFAPNEQVAEGLGQMFGSLLVLGGIGYVFLRRAR